MDWGNSGYQAATSQIGLGFVRYSAGTLSEAYDWTNGQFSWGSAFPGGIWTPSCLLDPRSSACKAGWGSAAWYAAWNVLDQNKTGQLRFDSWVSFSKGAQVATDVDVNVFTDQPASAGQLAAAFQAAGLSPELWERRQRGLLLHRLDGAGGGPLGERGPREALRGRLALRRERQAVRRRDPRGLPWRARGPGGGGQRRLEPTGSRTGRPPRSPAATAPRRRVRAPATRLTFRPTSTRSRSTPTPARSSRTTTRCSTSA